MMVRMKLRLKKRTCLTLILMTRRRKMKKAVMMKKKSREVKGKIQLR